MNTTTETISLLLDFQSYRIPIRHVSVEKCDCEGDARMQRCLRQDERILHNISALITANSEKEDSKTPIRLAMLPND